jgi:hypothetical protein
MRLLVFFPLNRVIKKLITDKKRKTIKSIRPSSMESPAMLPEPIAKEINPITKKMIAARNMRPLAF